MTTRQFHAVNPTFASIAVVDALRKEHPEVTMQTFRDSGSHYIAIKLDVVSNDNGCVINVPETLFRSKSELTAKHPNYKELGLTFDQVANMYNSARYDEIYKDYEGNI